MTISVNTLSVGLALVLTLPGCASTPYQVTTAATHTAAMMGQLKRELGAFQTAREVSDESLVALLKPLQKNLDRQHRLMNEDLRSREAAGDTQTVQLLGRLRSLSDNLREDDVAFQEAQAKLDADLASLLKPLPEVSSRFDSAISSLTLLGQDLPKKTQFDETLDVLRAVWKNTKENRDKLSQAIKSSP